MEDSDILPKQKTSHYTNKFGFGCINLFCQCVTSWWHYFCYMFLAIEALLVTVILCRLLFVQETKNNWGFNFLFSFGLNKYLFQLSIGCVFLVGRFVYYLVNSCNILLNKHHIFLKIIGKWKKNMPWEYTVKLDNKKVGCPEFHILPGLVHGNITWKMALRSASDWAVCFFSITVSKNGQ